MRRSPRSKSARLVRGFTLVELMAVVAITGILAAICITLARKHLRSASTVDAVAGMQGLRAAEESFKAENGRFLDCSRAAGPAWYPVQVPGKTAAAWLQPSHPDYAWWAQLGYRRELSRFGYLANAGLPGQTVATAIKVQMTTYAFDPAFVLPEPWYVLQVKGDRDGNGKPVLGMISSFNSDVFVQDDDE